jgi:hypothetical protein
MDPTSPRLGGRHRQTRLRSADYLCLLRFASRLRNSNTGFARFASRLRDSNTGFARFALCYLVLYFLLAHKRLKRTSNCFQWMAVKTPGLITNHSISLKVVLTIQVLRESQKGQLTIDVE